VRVHAFEPSSDPLVDVRATPPPIVPKIGNGFPSLGKLAARGSPVTMFWLAAALFMTGALLMLMPALWPSAGEAAQPAWRTMLALVALLPLSSVSTYLLLGNPQAIRPTESAAPATDASGQADRHSVSPEQIQVMVARLSERLQSEPGNAEGWAMLARSYTALGRYRDAVTAFGRANALARGNATLLADHADVLGMLQNKRLAGEPSRLIQQALDADPRHPKALALAGSAAFEVHDYVSARGYWERLLAVLPADAPMARSVRASLADAQRLEAGSTAVAVAFSPSAPAAAVATSAGPSAALTGEVDVVPALKGRIAPGDTLFVFARAVEGPRMPLAALRQAVGAWPLRFTLDDSQALSPAGRLSAFPQVVVGVRVSKSGQATPQSGDLIGQSAVLSPGTSGLHLLIDRVQP
jgi:cytochrome c-type biogenesis protein CcmH